MMLHMLRQSDASWIPLILCDHCRQPIQDPELGMVIWTDPAGWSTGTVGDCVDPLVIHKGRCDQQTSISLDSHRPWYELTDVLERLRGTKSTTRTSEILAHMRQTRGVGL